MTLAFPDLVWSHFSRPRFDDFDGRVRAAAAAGFAGVGLYAHAFGLMRENGRSAVDIANFASDHGIAIAEVETVKGWWATSGPAADECATVESLAYELADAAGVRYLQVIGSYECSLDQAVDGFASLCQRAAEHDLLVGIEFLPFTNIADAADAQQIVAQAGQANGGYCVDIWHHIRGANDMALIDDLPADRIFAVQVNDGTRQPVDPELDYKSDCLANRVPPGAGEFGCASFIRQLIDSGVSAPLSLEVCSTALWEASVGDAAHLAADGMRRVLAEAGV